MCICQYNLRDPQEVTDRYVWFDIELYEEDAVDGECYEEIARVLLAVCELDIRREERCCDRFES